VGSYLESLTREDLLRYVQVLSKNFLTLDGYWFLGVEDRYGQEKAIELDEEAWGRYGISEARRIKSFIGIDEGDLSDLAKALELISFGPASGFKIGLESGVVTLEVSSCRPQMARLESGKGEFPCKSVGIAHLTAFAKEINPRFKLTCIHCPPDRRPVNTWCRWEFRLGQRRSSLS
jgi:hypothetical protein